MLRNASMWRRCAAAAALQRKLPTVKLQLPQHRALSGTSSRCARAAAAAEPAPSTAASLHASTPSADDAMTTISSSSALAALEQSLDLRDHEQALQRFDALQSPPSTSIAQRLAILLAKQSHDAAHIARAHDVLKSVYMRPALQADDFTKLASIYVVDACLRHNMVDEALEIYEEALNVSVVLDLPAYDALLRGLVLTDRVDDAVSILKEVVAQNDVSPTEQTYAPLLLALMERCDYQDVIDVIDHGRTHGIAFTLDTYDPLVDLGEQQGDDPDCIDGLERFMVYVNQALEEDGLMTDFDDDDDIEIEFEDGDDDDDDHSSGSDDFDDNDEFR